jgi:5-(carboxyamino)imidazole ribonucleotide synthase
VKLPFPRVGIIGAGQLGRMSAAPATALGIDLVLLAESNSDSGAQIANFEIGDYRDLAQVREFAKKCNLVTFEHELIPISIVRALESEGIKFYPTSESFFFSQDKAAMRQRLANFPAPKWQVISNANEISEFPVIAKSISGGYDGRGVWKVNSESELEAILLKNPKLLVEELIDFDFEISVMVARSAHGQAATWAPTQTIQKDGICTMTISPAPDLNEDLSQLAQQTALTIAAEIKLIGVMAVEMFVKGSEIFINELAMRPHNSGHWTIDGSVTSQFEQHLRAILDLPLGDTSMTAKYAVMGNVLGGEKEDMYRPYLHLLARTPKLKIHQYRKEVKPGRKIGHVTLLGDNIVELTTEVQHAIDYMSGVIDE